MTIRWIADGELHNAQTHNRPLMDYIQNELSNLVRKTTMIHTSTGVSGGGSLENDISINGVAATETSIGMIQFATLAELEAGTRDDRALSSLDIAAVSFGLGSSSQSWHYLTNQRALGVTYVNDTGSPIVVSVTIMGDRDLTIMKVDGVIVSQIHDGGPQRGCFDQALTGIVPAGSEYQVINQRTSAPIPGGVAFWHELR